MSKILDAFHEGGWAMYPLFALGLITVGATARFALRGEHQLLAYIRWLLSALLLSAGFGFTVGMMKALHAAQGASEPMLAARIVMEGGAEAASMPATAFMFSIIACIGLAVGQRRFPLPNPSAVVR